MKCEAMENNVKDMLLKRELSFPSLMQDAIICV